MLEINHKLGYKFFSSSIKKHSADWITHYWQGKIKVFHICDGALICNRINTWFHWQRCLIVHYISNSPLDFFPFAITMNMKISFTVIIFISTHHLLCYFQVLWTNIYHFWSKWDKTATTFAFSVCPTQLSI